MPPRHQRELSNHVFNYGYLEGSYATEGSTYAWGRSAWGRSPKVGQPQEGRSASYPKDIEMDIYIVKKRFKWYISVLIINTLKTQ